MFYNNDNNKGTFYNEGAFYDESMGLEVRFTMKLRHGNEATTTKPQRRDHDDETFDARNWNDDVEGARMVQLRNKGGTTTKAQQQRNDDGMFCRSRRQQRQGLK